MNNKEESSLSSGMIVENTKKANSIYQILCYLFLSKQVSMSEHSSTFNSHARLRKENTTNSFELQADLSNLQGEDTLHLLLLWASDAHFSVPVTVRPLDLGVTLYIQVYFVWYISNAKTMP